MSKNENPIRFGIMGCAEIARKVSRAIHLAPNATLAAVASRSIGKAKEFAARNKLSENVKLYGSYDELLDDPFVDAVYMPLPTSLHLKWAAMAAQKGKHLLLEKPTALDVNMLDEMLKSCECNGLQFMDASMWYHHPRTVKMKELMSNLELFGRVRAIHSSSSYHGTSQFLENDIRVNPALDSLGALGDTGWYCIGAILWTMNQKLPTTVTALPTTIRNSAGVILTCSASLYWEEEETIATFYCSFISHETMSLAVCGSNATLHVDDFIIPYEENSAAFRFTSGAKFVDLHIGWNVKPQEVQVSTQLPQEEDPTAAAPGLLSTPVPGEAGVGGILPLISDHYLGFHPDRAAAAEKMIGVRPNFLIDYARTNSPKVDPRMPPEIRDAMEAPARGWSPDLERFCKEMPPQSDFNRRPPL